MPEIDYNSALLTVIFCGAFGFALWSVRQFTKLQLAILKLEKRMTKKIARSNAEGAKLVRDYFDRLMHNKEDKDHG